VVNWGETHMALILEGKSIGSNLAQKNSWFEEPRCKLMFKVGSNWRFQFASNGSKLVHANLDPRLSSNVGLSLA
jgi:hypothetical protein